MHTPILLARRPPHGDVRLIPTPPLQQTVIILNFFFPALAVLVVGLRYYSRFRFHQFGIDDFLIGCAMIFSLLMCPFFYMYIKLTYVGWNAVDVPQPYDATPGRWWFFVAQLFYNPVLALVKASVLVFLLRLGGHKRNVRYTIHGINIFNGLQAIAIFLVAVFQCLPISANWDPIVQTTARCVDNSFHVVISCLTILTDIALLVLPFWIFLGLKMPTPAKVAVIGVFLLGAAVLITSIIRLVKIVQLFYIPSSIPDPFRDIGTILNVAEINIAIISASGPALRGLFRRWMPTWFGGSSGRTYGTSSQRRGGAGGGKYGYGTGYGRGTTRSNVQHEDSTNGIGYASGGGGGGSGGNGSGGVGGIALKSMHNHHRSMRGGHTEIRSVSPSGSEEEIMTYNGIMRTTDVEVHYDREGDAATSTEAGSISRASSDLKLGKEMRQ